MTDYSKHKYFQGFDSEGRPTYCACELGQGSCFFHQMEALQSQLTAEKQARERAEAKFNLIKVKIENLLRVSETVWSKFSRTQLVRMPSREFKKLNEIGIALNSLREALPERE